MGGAYGEGGLAQARRAGDQDHAGVVALDEVVGPGQFGCAAGEVVDRSGQFAQAARARPVVAQAAVSGVLDELPAVGLGQGEGVGHGGDGPVLGSFAASAFHVRQGAGADPRQLGELFEGQPCRATVAA
ncbi:hypothetical protein GCM10018965_019350 [Nonomuraea roseola]